MKKRILPIIASVFLCLTMLLPLCAHAVTPLDPEAESSLTLHYQKDGLAFPNQLIGIYRVAEAFPDGSFELIEPFASYPIHIHDITRQEQWNQVAQVLYSRIVADQVQPDREALTDENGTVCFSQLETGLYFVREVVTSTQESVYIFNQFLVYVPTPQPDGSYNYHVEAVPKCLNYVPMTHYTVTKLWQDSGNQESRPKSIEVEIYKDGVLQETQILSAENHWTYSWSVPAGDKGKWTVAESSVPQGYRMILQQNGAVFTIVNIRPYDPGDPDDPDDPDDPTVPTIPDNPENPKTGDTFTPLPWILGMCVSGILLLILGLYSRRRK